ncbi:uncharacterized protein LOC142230982 [Haematobia irritans]|uniref:uncharacterized protein LOC142230982 n=1 Tax=Haematobia irritans TaxID=7368 RepID=UPI003F4FEF28
MSSKSLLLILAIGLTTATIVSAKRDFRIELLEITHNVSAEITFLKCLNYNITNKRIGDLDVSFSQDIEEMPSKLSLNLYITKSTRSMKVMETQIDICRFLNAKHNNFLSIVAQELRRTSNFPRKCPFLKDVIYSIKNYTINDESYPPFFPKGNFQYDIQLKPNNVREINIRIKGSVSKIDDQ